MTGFLTPPAMVVSGEGSKAQLEKVAKVEKGEDERERRSKPPSAGGDAPMKTSPPRG